MRKLATLFALGMTFWAQNGLSGENFVTVQFEEAPYNGRITFHLDPIQSWIDYMYLEIDGSAYIKKTPFIQGFYQYTHPVWGPSVTVDFKDGTKITFFENFQKAMIQIADQRYLSPMSVSRSVRSTEGYHYRFPSETEPSPIFAADLNKTVYRRGLRGQLWTPSTLKEYVEKQMQLRCKNTVTN